MCNAVYVSCLDTSSILMHSPSATVGKKVEDEEEEEEKKEKAEEEEEEEEEEE